MAASIASGRVGANATEPHPGSLRSPTLPLQGRDKKSAGREMAKGHKDKVAVITSGANGIG